MRISDWSSDVCSSDLIALDKQVATLPCYACGHRCNSEADAAGENHAQRFILDAAGQAWIVGLEDLRRRRAVNRHGDLPIDDRHRQLLLRAGKAHRYTVLANQKRPRGQFFADPLTCAGIRACTISRLA